MVGEMAGQGGVIDLFTMAKAWNFAAMAAPGLDIRTEIVYFGYFT